MEISVWSFAFICVFCFFAGSFAEYLRKDIKRMEATQVAFKVGYRTGFQTAELKFAPSHPVPEDFENWPPVSGSPHDPAQTRVMGATNCMASGVAGICYLSKGHDGAHHFQ